MTRDPFSDDAPTYGWHGIVWQGETPEDGMVVIIDCAIEFVEHYGEPATVERATDIVTEGSVPPEVWMDGIDRFNARRRAEGHYR